MKVLGYMLFGGFKERACFTITNNIHVNHMVMIGILYM